MDDLQNDFEKGEYLQNLLLTHATGGHGDDEEYKALRKHFLNSQALIAVLPSFVRTNRDLFQFWQFIKRKFDNYAERREYLWREFAPLLERLEKSSEKPSDREISGVFKSFDTDSVHEVWQKALERRSIDPEGAITSARTLIETVCKQILDRMNIPYNQDKTDLPELYKLTSKALNLAPSQHTEDTFKKILGGVTTIVNELGSLRNRIGDAHGKGKKRIRPATRHAELAVNLAGAAALFLVETWLARTEQQ